jgi:two-component system, LytTR family, response regulator LytT
MTRVGILDDEVIICETLRKYLLELGYEVLDYALNFEEGLNVLSQNPDIMLLDINIGGPKTGIDLAEIIRAEKEMPIIFISSYSDPTTLEAAKGVKPNGYLVKPFTQQDLYTSIEVALSNYAGSKLPEENAEQEDCKLLPDALFVKQNSLYVKINFADIVYIKSDGVYVEIFTKDRRFLVRQSLKNLQNILPESYFLQVHRSYIINLHCIEAINHEYIVIQKEVIPISRSQRDLFLQRLTLL